MSAELNIKDSHIRVNGIDYFRGGAENVVLGSFGEKKTPLFKINYLEHQGTLPSDKLKVREATVLDIDQASQMAISRSLKAEASGTIAGVPVTVLDVDGRSAPEGYRHKLVLCRDDQHVAWRGDAVPSDAAALVAVLLGATDAGAEAA